MRQRAVPYLFISPFYILFFVFMLGPALFAFYISFTGWRGLATPDFIGLQNYSYLLKDSTFHKSLLNTFKYAVVGVVIVIPIALFLASLLNITWLRGKSFFRAVYFLPVITPAVVVGIVFSMVYDQQYGIFNWALLQINLPIIKWMTADYFKLAVVGMIVWRWCGYHMVYFLAGLQGIPKDIYEAAAVDGANTFQKFLHITIPSLRPIIIFILVIMTISSLQIFDEPYMLLNDGRGFGGPQDSGLSITMYLYRTGFIFMRRGYGSAIGSILFTLILIIARIQTKVLGLFKE